MEQALREELQRSQLFELHESRVTLERVIASARHVGGVDISAEREDLRLRITIFETNFAIVRLPSDAEFDISRVKGFCSVTRSGHELSVICRTDSAPTGGTVSEGWRCMRVEDLLGLDAPGVLLAAIRPISTAHISVFAIATFDTDHLLVRSEHVIAAEHLLRSAGHSVTKCAEA